jgi:hypothetical protein
MVPKISARFRKRKGISFAIEQLSGKQFRCRHCNTVFLTEPELERHVYSVAANPAKKKAVHQACPRLSSSVEVRVLYTYDIIDKQKRQWLKLKSGDEYDGP